MNWTPICPELVNLRMVGKPDCDLRYHGLLNRPDSKRRLKVACGASLLEPAYNPADSRSEWSGLESLRDFY
jgi:hypothetical protein